MVASGALGPLFDEQEKRFLRDSAPHLAAGARRALLFGEATDPESVQAPVWSS